MPAGLAGRVRMEKVLVGTLPEVEQARLDRPGVIHRPYV